MCESNLVSEWSKWRRLAASATSGCQWQRKALQGYATIGATKHFFFAWSGRMRICSEDPVNWGIGEKELVSYPNVASRYGVLMSCLSYEVCIRWLAPAMLQKKNSYDWLLLAQIHIQTLSKDTDMTTLDAESFDAFDSKMSSRKESRFGSMQTFLMYSASIYSLSALSVPQLIAVQ